MKCNIITHITTSCNFDCSYCDVIKDKKFLSSKQKENILDFIGKNSDFIGRFKFFWWEPLIAYKDMKYIIDNSSYLLGDNYEIVTNTTFLNDQIWEYFQKFFSHIFFSIDSENIFDYNKVIDFIRKYNLEHKLYFNLIISPWQHEIAFQQFQRLYNSGMRGFNILPVYFTQSWTKPQLMDLWDVMKKILDISIRDSSLRLYGFQENKWYDTSLANNTLFIDIDGNIYYSDIASTFSGQTIRKKLLLGNTENFDIHTLSGYNFHNEKKYISLLEENIYNRTMGQRELHKMMDYFSEYLNKKDGK